jgi:two-component system sensor histidine kinase RpfC
MFIRMIATRLRDRPDREHEMILNRLAISVAILGYVLVIVLSGTPGMHSALAIGGAYVAAAVLLFGHMVWSPGVSVTRRLLAMLIDLGLLSCGLHFGGPLVAALYPFYLWIIFGNGFRFGVPYLYAATGLSVAGFGLVGLTTKYWAQNLPLTLGLLAGLVILPLGCQEPGREGQSSQEPVSCQRQPRTSHAADRGHRDERPAVRHQARSPAT